MLFMNGGESSDSLALAKAIAKARKIAGLTQQELCAKAGLSYSTLAKIERGAIKTPSVFTVAVIAAATHTTVEQLTGIQSGNVMKTQKNYKTSKNGVKFVYFDVNGVLVRFFQRAFTNIAADTGTPIETIESVFWHYDDMVCRGELGIADFNRALADKINVTDISWAKYYLESIEPVPELIDALKWTSQYYPVGLLTNIMPGLVNEMINRDILPKIDYTSIVESNTVGSIKPEQLIFDNATRQAGVKPREILFIDDSRQNLMAAEKLGWNVLWFDDYRPGESEQRIKDWLEF